MKKSAKLIFKVLSGLGIIMLLIAGYLYFKKIEFKKNALITSGQVVELVEQQSSKNKKIRYVPKVSYFISGKKYFYLSTFSSSNKIYQVGEKVIVYYDPKNINNVTLDEKSSYTGILLLAGLGFVYTSLGLMPLYFEKRKKEKNEWLKQNGRKIQARFDGVILKNIYQVKRDRPYIIKAQFLNTANNEVYFFDSDDIWFDPTPFLQNKETIDVFIDSNNYKKYYLDTSFLPKET